jgi:chromate transport protein ChrA
VAVVGLIAAAAWRLIRSEARTPPLVAVLMAGAVLGFFVHAVIVVVGAGLVGALLPEERGNG